MDGPDDDYGPPIDSGPSLVNLEAEAAFLGACLIDNRVLDDTIMLITATDFFEPLHHKIYRIALAKHATGELASPVTLKPMFETDPDMIDRGGTGYLSSLASAGALVIGAKDFAKQIADLAKLRQLRDGAQAFLKSLGEYDERSTVNGYLGQLEAIAAKVMADTVTSDSFTAAQAVDRVINNVVAIQDGSEPPGVNMAGLEHLQRVLGPFVRKHLQVWAGRPGMGKSALTVSSALGLARAGHSVGLISLEMGDLDLGQRIAADVAHFNGEAVKHAHIRDAKLSVEELRTIARTAADIRDWPLQIEETAGVTISRIGTIMRRMKRVAEAKGERLSVVFVDYLQLILPDKESGNRTSDVTAISNALKRYAKELDVCVVALSQLSRAVEQREDKRPQLSDLRESGAIEQDADLVAFLFREEYYLEHRKPDNERQPDAYVKWLTAMDACRDRLEVHVPKRRNGSTGMTKLLFLREYQAVRNVDFYELANRLDQGR